METSFWFGDGKVVRLAASDAPSRQAFVLFRGFPGEPPPGRAAEFAHLLGRRTLSAALHEATGSDVYVPNYEGLGGSRGRFTFAASVERSLAFALEHAAPRHERLHVAGYSWGGLVGFNVRRELGAKGGKLILVSALTDLGDEAHARAFLPRYVREYPNVFGEYDAALGPAEADLLSVRERFNPLTSVLRDHPAIEDVLILHGGEDEEVPVAQSRRFHDAVGGRYLELADDHIWTKHWDAMLGRVAAFAAER